MNRRLCEKCGLDYNLIFHRPKVDGICDVCKGNLVARADDNPEAVRSRLRDYHEKTTPILELFRRKELIINVDGTRDVTKVQQEIRSKLNLQK
jgi:adenylate kinase